MNSIIYNTFLKYPHVFINSQEAKDGGIFFAVGQLLDTGAHKSCQYAVAALHAGAHYAVINDKKMYEEHTTLQNRLFLVENGEKALQQLAAEHRQNLNIPIIAIAGSNGKTTVKELLRSLLAHQYNCFVTPKNLNNHLGLPLSILQIREAHQIAVLEIGANHIQETFDLCQIAAPTHGLVTNNGKDHLGEYGSVENIKKANAELYDYLAMHNKIAFIDQNNTELCEYSQHIQTRYFYGQNTNFYTETIDGLMLNFKLHIDKQIKIIQTQLFGVYWIDVFTAAAFIAYYFGIKTQQIQQSLNQYKPQNLRGERRNWRQGQVLLDCYNANPSSMSVFLATCQHPNMPKGDIANLLILGEMLELGEFSEAEHQQLIEQIQFNRFSHVLLVGQSFKNIKLPAVSNLVWFDNVALVKSWLAEQTHQRWFAFVKGSRANKLELIFE
jgi:UDP-N-acetylmuramoyl-tripeptide--D-alanyl-D-alanine ligase